MCTSKSRNKHVAKISCYKLGREAKPDSSNLRILLPRDEDSKTEQAPLLMLLVNRMSRRPLCETETLGAGGEGGYSTKFYTGRLHPKDQPLTVYTFFERKDTPFVYLPLTKSLSTPFKYLV